MVTIQNANGEKKFKFIIIVNKVLTILSKIRYLFIKRNIVMKLKLYILVVPILLASYVCVDAQNNLNILKYYSTEDSLNIDPYSFFPMQVGNFWQYAFLNEIVSEKTVVKDSVLENGHRLIWINSLDNPVWEIDINSRVFQYSPPDVEWTNLHYQLDANLGEEWIMSYSPDDSTRYFYRKVEDELGTLLLG